MSSMALVKSVSGRNVVKSHRFVWFLMEIDRKNLVVSLDYRSGKFNYYFSVNGKNYYRTANSTDEIWLRMERKNVCLDSGEYEWSEELSCSGNDLLGASHQFLV